LHANHQVSGNAINHQEESKKEIGTLIGKDLGANLAKVRHIRMIHAYLIQ
jgi:hypothetical protein